MRYYLLFSFLLFAAAITATAQLYTSAGSKLYTGNGGFITANNTSLQLNCDVSGNNNGKLICKGSTAQTINANGYIVYGLDIDNSNGITLSSNLQVSNTLTLENGIITTGNNILYLPSTATVSRQNGWVNGFLKKYIQAGDSVSTVFETGDALYYTPANFTFSKVYTGDAVTASAINNAGDEPNYSSFPLSKTNYINRYWQLSAGSDLSFSNYSVTLNYEASDATGSVDASALSAGIYKDGWNTFSTASSGTNTNTAGNVSVLGNIILANTDAVTQYTITSSADANGSISPDGAIYLNSGGSQTYIITPGSGYSVKDILVDGVSAGALTSYTFSNVTANHTIAASFVLNCSAPAVPKAISISKRFKTCDTVTTCSIKAVSSATSYLWQAPAGTSIISGQGTTSINLYVSDTFYNGRVSVSAVNNCGSSSAKQSALIYGRPIQPVISGPSCVSPNETGLVYTVSNTEDSITYTWRTPGMAKVTSGQGTDSATVAWRGNSGILYVTASNNCGSVRGMYPVYTNCASTAAVSNGQASRLYAVITPNPAESQAVLYIGNIKAPVSVSIFDVHGRTALQLSGVQTQKTNLPLQKLAGGIYFVKINDGANTITLKLIKE